VRTVVVATPTQSGQVTVQYCNSLLMEALHGLKAGVAVCPYYCTGGSILPLARNQAVSDFLASDATDLVFVDADEGWEPGAVMRLISHPVDIVGGAVRLKKEPEEYALSWMPTPELWADENGLIEVMGLGSGFLRLSRKAIETMARAYPELSYQDGGCTLGTAWALFDNSVHQGRYWGEDTTFCRRARDRGLKIYLDPEIEFTHTGVKTYAGSIGHWLRARRDSQPPTQPKQGGTHGSST
jgi:hypothetical protein